MGGIIACGARGCNASFGVVRCAGMPGEVLMLTQRSGSGRWRRVMLGVTSSGPALSLVAAVYMYGLRWANPTVSVDTFLLLETIDQVLSTLAGFAWALSAVVCVAWLLRRMMRRRGVLVTLVTAGGVLLLLALGLVALAALLVRVPSLPLAI